MVQLREYQKKIVSTIVNQKNVLIVAPMGAGKTLSTLTALATLIARGEIETALILAPKRVAMSVWAQEAERHELGLNIQYCKTALDVKLFLLSPATHHIAVCSVTRISEIPHGCWDCVIMDESTLFKHKSSNRSKEARRICNKVPRRIELSGTPVHNGLEGLWHQCFLLDGGKSLGKSLTAFRQTYCREKFKVNGVVSVYEVMPERIPYLMRDCKDLVYIVRNNAELPPMLYKDVFVELPKKTLKAYKDFEDTNVIKFVEDGNGNPYKSEKSLLAFCRASLGAKLRQFASGFIYADDDNHKVWERVHTEKLAALKELTEGFDGGILVAYQFQSEYEEIKNAFPMARRIETEQDIEDWNNGDIPIALVHPMSAGHGLNLQFGGHVLVWYSLTYDAELYAQLNKRLHRSGQRETVSIVHLIAKDTIDERILKVLQQKENVADSFVSM